MQCKRNRQIQIFQQIVDQIKTIFFRFIQISFKNYFDRKRFGSENVATMSWASRRAEFFFRMKC